ncbi:hypothetical protein [Paenibacillus sp. Root52]|uniref:hypothetical protein n=1 Tax=Paenibacillus sp. Root52 TaxID=1736552 RepID=UPI0012E38E41|nr:hypothetical protein [Paenibacillus sp. Root52]
MACAVGSADCVKPTAVGNSAASSAGTGAWAGAALLRSSTYSASGRLRSSAKIASRAASLSCGSVQVTVYTPSPAEVWFTPFPDASDAATLVSVVPESISAFFGFEVVGA